MAALTLLHTAAPRFEKLPVCICGCPFACSSRYNSGAVSMCCWLQKHAAVVVTGHQQREHLATSLSDNLQRRKKLWHWLHAHASAYLDVAVCQVGAVPRGPHGWIDDARRRA